MALKIRDFMNLETLQSIQETFAQATGLAAIGMDSDGEYITKASNFTDFCMKYTRGSEEGARRCKQCDMEGKGAYRCHAGLMDFAIDIIVDGERAGKILGGQVLPEKIEEQKYREIARQLKINEEQYISALKRVPVKTEKEIKAAIDLLGIVINTAVNAEYMIQVLIRESERQLNQLELEVQEATTIIHKVMKQTVDLGSIASKQNILSLNASIEAARSGDAGLGFAVVAAEMGNLAKTSAGIHKDILGSTSELNNLVVSMKQTFLDKNSSYQTIA